MNTGVVYHIYSRHFVRFKLKSDQFVCTRRDSLTPVLLQTKCRNKLLKNVQHYSSVQFTFVIQSRFIDLVLIIDRSFIQENRMYMFQLLCIITYKSDYDN